MALREELKKEKVYTYVILCSSQYCALICLLAHSHSCVRTYIRMCNCVMYVRYIVWFEHLVSILCTLCVLTYENAYYFLEYVLLILWVLCGKCVMYVHVIQWSLSITIL